MLDDPGFVRSEYTDPSRLGARMAIYDRAVEAALAAVVETHPMRVLDAGAGTGVFAARVAAATGAAVTAIDTSAAMVALAQAAGVDAVEADARALPAPAAAFDCVVANWMLYHVPDRDRAIAEAARVLRPKGRLVAATFSERNLEEVWDALGDDTPRGHGFTAENGAAQMRGHFAHVEERPVAWEIAWSDRDELRGLVAANIRRAHLSDRVAHIDLPLMATARHTVFVAERPAGSGLALDAG
jgi:ubiquinone/menaquinone biosynthesis C-methylase UbiE